jgi:hypothetical protein
MKTLTDRQHSLSEIGLPTRVRTRTTDTVAYRFVDVVPSAPLCPLAAFPQPAGPPSRGCRLLGGLMQLAAPAATSRPRAFLFASTCPIRWRTRSRSVGESRGDDHEQLREPAGNIAAEVGRRGKNPGSALDPDASVNLHAPRGSPSSSAGFVATTLRQARARKPNTL